MQEREYRKYEGDGAQARFTAYLLEAIKNARLMYLRKKAPRDKHEVLIEAKEFMDYFVYEPDMWEGFSAIEQLEDARLQAVLRKIKERDLYIFLQKAVCDRTLRDISVELDLSFNTASTAYHRVVRRIRQELRGDDDGVPGDIAAGQKRR